MKSLLYTKLRSGLLCLLLIFGFTINLQSQSDMGKKVIITLTSIDANGNTTVEKMVKTGEEASEEAIDKIVQEALQSKKSVDIEVEQTEVLEGNKGITKTLERFTNKEGTEGEIELEITLDEDGKIDSEKVVEKEVRIIKAMGDKGEEIEKILEENGIDIKDIEGADKEVRIIKMRVESEEEVDIDEILKKEGINLEEMEGQQKRVRIIKKEKAANSSEEEEHTIIKITDTEVNIQREDVEAKIKKLGIVLPKPAPPVANYVNAVRSNKLIFLAGKGPNKPEGGYITGKVGRDLTVKEGYEAARLAGIIQLAALKAEIGDLNRVKRIVKVLGMVNATADFTNHPEVINGFSDLMVEVFGDRGKHARAAVGMYSLPRNIAVEVEMIVEIE